MRERINSICVLNNTGWVRLQNRKHRMKIVNVSFSGWFFELLVVCMCARSVGRSLARCFGLISSWLFFSVYLPKTFVYHNHFLGSFNFA